MMVKLIFTKIGNFIENRQIFMLLNCNCAKLANVEHFKTYSGGHFCGHSVFRKVSYLELINCKETCQHVLFLLNVSKLNSL